MNSNRNDYEPIIAERRSRRAEREEEEEQPLWRLMLLLAAGLVVAALVAWWWMNRSSSNTASAPAETAAPIPAEEFPEERIEQTQLPSARDAQASAEVAPAPVPPVPDSVPGPEQASTPENSSEAQSAPEAENVSEGASEEAVQPPAPPAQVSVQFTSPDPQVRIELRGPDESSPPVVGKAGDVITVVPGTYRVITSGSQLESLQQDVTFDGDRPLEYTVELCAERAHERESLGGQVVEERECASTEQCESMFMVLSEEADQLVRDRAFRAQQCAKWRPNSTPEGRWTLDIKCGGATVTSCRIEVGEGSCSLAEARRSERGTECPRAELR